MSSKHSPTVDFSGIESPEERAIAIASEAHRGQLDKHGQPFIYHLLRVMLSTQGAALRQVAVLHDLIEDTAWTLEQLSSVGFTPDVINAVALLTREPTTSYSDYVIRLAQDPLARQSKIADLNDNYRLDRVALRRDHESEDMARIARYILSHDFLLGRITEEEYRNRIGPFDD